MASGLAGNAPITEEGSAYEAFREALFSVCRSLAMTMAADGEGATHLMEMRVYNADTVENARILAKSVVGSSLVKAMVFGRDANCGRILNERVVFYTAGRVQPFDEDRALAILSEKAVRFSCDMHMGGAEATAWGCDLTYDYVKINGDYRS